MSTDWQMDSNRDTHQHRRSDQDPLRTDEIELLRPEQGRLERMLHSFVSRFRRVDDQGEPDPVDFRDAELRGRDFSRRNLTGADFRGADLREANFTDANLAHALFSNADLRNANLANACCVSVDLQNANLASSSVIGADFAGANLRGADLGDSYMWGADFDEADVKDANFSGAYAGGALFSRTRNLTLKQFRSTIHDETGAYRLSMLPDPPKGKRR